MTEPKIIQDPYLGEYYRATCEICGKVIESSSVKVVLNNLIAHRGTHNGHA